MIEAAYKLFANGLRELFANVKRVVAAINWARVRAAGSGLLDVAAKLAAPLAVVVAALVAQNFQSSMTVSQLLSQREQSDTQIRAEMFKAITEKLLGDKGGEPPPERKAVFTELLALNFHEHIELKPLMVEVDDALLAQKANATTEAERTRIKDKRFELLSVARRVRARQTAMLIRPDPAVGDWAGWSPSAAKAAEESRFKHGDVRMLSVRFTGPNPSTALARPSPCDIPKQSPGQSACVDEPIMENAPDGHGAIAISVKKADWGREAFTLLVKPSQRLELSPQEKEELEKQSNGDAPYCGVKLGNSNPGAETASSAGSVEFETTWFDLPLTDNTPLATGSRYAVFIDRVCPEEGEDGDRVVKLGLVWFPRDYFPARERPTNYRQFREKLNLPLAQ